MSLPEVEERLSHGEPAWFVSGKRLFVMFADHHHDQRVAFWCAALPGSQLNHVESNPEEYFVPPYVGTRGWLGVYLDVAVDWERAREHVLEAYHSVAPKKLSEQATEQNG